MKITVSGIPELEAELDRLNAIRWEAVRKEQVTEMLNRARAPGGTPVSTEETRPGGPHGELRRSLGSSGEEVGYTKEYAPHVEYGHRTANGGYIQGQHFLQDNVEAQRPIYREDLIKAIKKEKR